MTERKRKGEPLPAAVKDEMPAEVWDPVKSAHNGALVQKVVRKFQEGFQLTKIMDDVLEYSFLIQLTKIMDDVLEYSSSSIRFSLTTSWPSGWCRGRRASCCAVK
jgi:hypothetical protein